MKNREAIKDHHDFEPSCSRAGVAGSDRQISKWLNGKGRAKKLCNLTSDDIKDVHRVNKALGVRHDTKKSSKNIVKMK